MKRLGLVLLLASIALCSQAQRRSRMPEEKQRDLMIIVRDTAGNPLDQLPVFALINGQSKVTFPRMDRFGNRRFRVVESDDFELYVHDRVFRFEAAGIDSLDITIRMPQNDSVEYIDPVRVTARRKKEIDTGYGMTIDPDTYVGVGYLVDMNYAPSVTYALRRRLVMDHQGFVLIRGRRIRPRMVVDGFTIEGELTDLDAWSPSTIESVFVDRGLSGNECTVIITTKRWSARKK